MKNLTGRKKEAQLIEKLINNRNPEFIAVYGRRRVGKTFLITSIGESKDYYFELSGSKDAKLSTQLTNFSEQFAKAFSLAYQPNTPASWHDAFNMLTDAISNIPKTKKCILFFDELPWLASRKSGFLQTLDYFWNTHWSKLPQVKLIVCGSAASWMLEKLINAKGGLYNRVTHSIFLKPFTLSETQEYLLSIGCKFNHKQILDIYMAMGGIPFYLRQIDKNKSAAQNINAICFNENGILFDEFDRIFKSLFDHADINKNIVISIAKRRYGISREQLLKDTNLTSGGTFNKRIAELEASCFIESFIPYGKKKKDKYYKLTDEYTAFYLKWIAPFKQTQSKTLANTYWQNMLKTPSWNSWAGLTYETICFKHAAQVQQALGLLNTACTLGNWKQTSKKGSDTLGAQIDMLFDRTDDAMTLCEIKYCQTVLTVDKAMAKNIANKLMSFEKNTNTKKQLFVALITINGIKQNIWSEDLINQVVVLKDLFK